MATPHLYAIDAQGDLLWYRHLGREDGTFRWDGPNKVGTGWGGFERVFSGGDGIIYAIEPAVPQLVQASGGTTPASGGRLLWYRHVGHDDGSFRWEGPRPVGTGWSGFEHVFAAGNGVIYVVEPHVEPSVHATVTPQATGGNLRWYRHKGWKDGSFDWDGPHKVGTGWSGFERVWSGGGDVIYLIEPRVAAPVHATVVPTGATGGRLRWYRHLGREDGSFRWLGPQDVGTGWSGFEHVCSGDNGVIYLIEPRTVAALRTVGKAASEFDGRLRWYRHVGRNDGSFKWEGPKTVGTRWDGMKAFFSEHESATAAGTVGRFCEFLDAPGTPQIGIKSYLVKDRGRSLPLTWSLTGVVPGLNASQMLSSVSAAFALWTRAVPALVFTQAAGPAAITISVRDLGAADAAGNVVAGLTSPDGSSIAFTTNAAVSFVASGPGGTSLLSIAAHEIGHAIGILHSSTPGSLMFPRGGVVETLGIEDIEAVCALYAWTPQTPVPGIGSSASPALCVCGATLVMAWRGVGRDNRIWTSRSTDGLNWSAQRAVPGTGTTDGPTLAWDGTRLWLAIRGISGDDKLYWATSGDLGLNWSAVNVIPGTGSACAPAMTLFNGAPLLVWRGVSGDEGLYYTVWRNPWAAQQPIPGTGSSDRPSVCVFDNVPRMVWRGVTGDDSLYTAPFIGQTWQAQQQLQWVKTGNGNAGTVGYGVPGSVVGPSLAADGTRVCMAWQGVIGDDAIYYTQAATAPAGAPAIEWSSQAIVPGVGTSHRPAIAAFKGLPVMAWTGAGSDTTVYVSRQVLP